MSIPSIEARKFRVGKYDVVGRPIPHSAHMLRYTVFVDGVRIGALASVPTESDCLFLEKPPVVPRARTLPGATSSVMSLKLPPSGALNRRYELPAA